MTDALTATKPATRPHPPRCSDFDDDCRDIPDVLHCWLYDPAKGYCPLLRRTGDPQ